MGLVGIYSYPKSGSTWIRAILGNVMAAEAGPVPDLHRERLIPQIPDLHRQSLAEAFDFHGFRFFKSHAGTDLKTWRNEAIDATHVIHIRRNPLDVFISYLNFLSANVTGNAPVSFASVEALRLSPLFGMYFHTFIMTGHLVPDFRPVTGGYFQHNFAWLKQDGKQIAHLRYEDLLHAPETALSFLEDWLPLAPGQLNHAIHAAAGDTCKDGKFFWKQREKTYFEYLRPEEIELFLTYRGAECEALGYDPEYLRAPPEPALVPALPPSAS